MSFVSIILVDDDPLIARMWQLKASQVQNIQLKVAANFAELENLSHEINEDTHVYFDLYFKIHDGTQVYLGNKILQLLKELGVKHYFCISGISIEELRKFNLSNLILKPKYPPY